jgi:hypothetical protein
MSKFNTLILLVADMTRDIPSEYGYIKQIELLRRCNDFRSTVDCDVAIEAINRMKTINESSSNFVGFTVSRAVYLSVKECLDIFISAIEKQKKLITNTLIQAKVDSILLVVQDELNKSAPDVYSNFFTTFSGKVLLGNSNFSKMIDLISASDYKNKHFIMYSLMRVKAFQEEMKD